jgi:prepilin signal peptidase PulO-like enzyme (type II secretory pathway)
MELLADLVFVAMLAVVTVTDLRERLIPNRVLIAALATGLPLLALADPGTLSGRLGAALAGGGVFLGIALARPGAFGLGDVKLIAVIGLFLGEAVVEAVLIALLGGSLLGVVLFACHGRAAAKHTIPFGPFLALGGLLALLVPIPPLQ